MTEQAKPQRKRKPRSKDGSRSVKVDLPQVDAIERVRLAMSEAHGFEVRWAQAFERVLNKGLDALEDFVESRPQLPFGEEASASTSGEIRSESDGEAPPT